VSEAESELAARLSARLAHLGQDYCIFTRSGRDFALGVEAAREVLTAEPATPVPQAPSLLVGVINLRGEVLPLVQIDSLLNLPTRSYALGDQILVVSVEDVDMGLVVDRVRDLRSIDSNEIQPHPRRSAGSSLFRGYWPGSTGAVNIVDAHRLIEEVVRAVNPFAARDGDSVPMGRVASSSSP
jgi:purine-binding chemotaxis protein CheW